MSATYSFGRGTRTKVIAGLDGTQAIGAGVSILAAVLATPHVGAGGIGIGLAGAMGSVPRWGGQPALGWGADLARHVSRPRATDAKRSWSVDDEGTLHSVSGSSRYWRIWAKASWALSDLEDRGAMVDGWGSAMGALSANRGLRGLSWHCASRAAVIDTELLEPADLEFCAGDRSGWLGVHAANGTDMACLARQVPGALAPSEVDAEPLGRAELEDLATTLGLGANRPADQWSHAGMGERVGRAWGVSAWPSQVVGPGWMDRLIESDAEHSVVGIIARPVSARAAMRRARSARLASGIHRRQMAMLGAMETMADLAGEASATDIESELVAGHGLWRTSALVGVLCANRESLIAQSEQIAVAAEGSQLGLRPLYAWHGAGLLAAGLGIGAAGV